MGKTYELLSFDIWDTILRRKCHPDEIKLFASKYLYLRYNKQLKEEYKSAFLIMNERINCEGIIAECVKNRGLDNEYTLYEVFNKLITKVFIVVPEANMKDKVIDELINVEKIQEKSVTYLDPNIKKKLNKISYNRCAYISDFYADSSFINDILDNVNFKLKVDNSYVSCEHYLNKRSGNIYNIVHKDLNILPNKHYHIGDNTYSDYEIPRSLGICANHYKNAPEERKRERLKRYFINREKGITEFVNEKTSKKGNIQGILGSFSKKGKLHALGREYSIIFYTFILNIIEDAIKNNISKIYYFTREGEFFKKIHDAIKECNPLGIDIPDSELLEVSRLSTFFPSLREFSLKELMRIWNLYSTQSMRALFKSINVNIDDFKEYFQKYNIDIESSIQYPWLNTDVIRLFDDREFIENINRRLSDRKDALMEYFFIKGISPNTEKIAIVDIGWRGTIQDNICYIFNNTEVIGYYFGLFNFINEQPLNSKKKSFIKIEDDKRMKFALRNVAPFEMLNNSPNGSVIEYLHSDNKEIYANRLQDDDENSIHNQFIKYFQNGVLSSVRDISEVVRIHAIASEELVSDSYTKLNNLMTNPPRILAKAFLKLSHNETFGVGGFINKKTKFPFILFINALFSYKKKKEFKGFIENTTWPQGFLNYYFLNIVTYYYNDKVYSKV